jgi:hypothetical protein
VLSIVIGRVSYAIVSSANARVNIPLAIKDNPFVSNVEIVYNDGVVHSEFCIKILFKNSSTLELHGVNEWGKGSINIYKVDNSLIRITNKNGGSIRNKLEMKYWSCLTGLRLESVMDIVKNYPVILGYIESCPNLTGLKEYPDEKLYETRKRALENYSNSCKSVIINNEKYYLLRYEEATTVARNANLLKN